MFKCSFCSRELKSISWRTRSSHVAKCKEFKNFSETVFTEKFLRDQYVVHGKAAIEIARENGLRGAKHIIHLLHKYDILLRTQKESVSTSRAMARRKKTLLNRYGVEHNFQKGTPRQEMRNNIKIKYGVDNVFQLDSVKIKSRNTILKKYSAENYCQYHRNIILPRLRLGYLKKYGVSYNKPFIEAAIKVVQNKEVTKPQLVVNKIIESLGIAYEREYKISTVGKRYYLCDIFIEEYNLVIEINGDYWHANPKFYSPNDMLLYPGGACMVSKKWAMDLERSNFIISRGYGLLIFWQDQIKNDASKTKEDICKYLKLFQFEKLIAILKSMTLK